MNVHQGSNISPGTAENTAPASARLNNDEMAAVSVFEPIPLTAPMAAGVPAPADRSGNARPPLPPAMPRSEAMPIMPPSVMPTPATMPRPQTPHMPIKPETEECGYKKGELPPCAPLAAAFVPFQQKDPPKYAAADALTHGTLFPGLDLPFMNIANNTRC
ncbi:MAG: spore coat associated protein CotJA [Oscillospiraceae bacterium]|nr:spore coat associated protein CotJA [Oscillospiraceae bacterium]